MDWPYYEDSGQPVEARVEDLLSQMNLEEKAGMMFLNGVPISGDARPEGRVDLQGGSARLPTVVERMAQHQMNYFNIWEIPADPTVLARWYNLAQQLAEKNRLGIPITFFSDPRHHFSKNIFAVSAIGFSQFCTWTTPVVAHFSTDRDETPFITPDGKYFFFGSERPIPGQPNLGNFDMNIWMMEKNQTGWTEAKPIGPKVNSVNEESSPQFSRDGKYFFFSRAENLGRIAPL